MDILFLLVPLSVVLVFAIVGMLAWALGDGQFDDLEHQGELVFDADEMAARAVALRAARDAQTTAARADASLQQPPLPLVDLGQRGQGPGGA